MTADEIVQLLGRGASVEVRITRFIEAELRTMAAATRQGGGPLRAVW